MHHYSKTQLRKGASKKTATSRPADTGETSREEQAALLGESAPPASPGIVRKQKEEP